MNPSILPPPLHAERVDTAGQSRAERLFPLLTTLRGYKRSDFRGDFIAGLTVALFTIPQGMAYALIAGFPPSAGLATAVAASILGAAFGSSEYLINGPTNAIAVMIAGNAALFATQGDPIQAIILLTLIIGVVQTIAGLLRLGTMTRFVSESVLVGFTAGAGVYIVVNQLPGFLGVARADVVPTLWGWVPTKCALFDFMRLVSSLHHIHLATLALASGTFVCVRVLQRLEPSIGRRVPAPFAAVVIVSVLAWLLGLTEDGTPHRVALIRDIEPLTRSLPWPRMPTFDAPSFRALAQPAFAIGLMGAVEAVAIGKSLATRMGQRFDASRQLVGEGLCNVGAAMVGGFAASGSFSRTMVNFESGATTRMSCIFSGALVLVIVVLFAPQANEIPTAALAGTLVHIGLKLVDIGRLKAVFDSTPGDRMVLVVTFLAVLFAEHLENALFIGIGTSIYYALRRAEGFKLRVLLEGEDGVLREDPDVDPADIGDVTVLNLQGELYFAAAEELAAELTRQLDANTRFLVLRVQEAFNADATTVEAIASVAEKARARGGRLILCGVRQSMYGVFERAGLLDKIGKDSIFQTERDLLQSTRRAIAFAHELSAKAAEAAAAAEAAEANQRS
ncbi:MAG: SulP family inorganic anion transporter [Sandaracinaceae bacterium]|nr:SulP family inorganic anion transporter [Sandaracinaceae bacterium]